PLGKAEHGAGLGPGPPRVIGSIVLNTVGLKFIVSAPGVEFAWPTAQRRLPRLPSSRALRTVKVDGTVRSSRPSTGCRARCGTLRIGWVMGRRTHYGSRNASTWEPPEAGSNRRATHPPRGRNAARLCHAGPVAQTVAATSPRHSVGTTKELAGN